MFGVGGILYSPGRNWDCPLPSVYRDRECADSFDMSGGLIKAVS